MGGFFPDGVFPEGHFPEGHFPEVDGVAPDAGRRRFWVTAPRARFSVSLMDGQIGNGTGFHYRVAPAIKNAGTELAVELNLYDFCAQKWLENEDVSVNEFVLPTKPTGFAYEASAAGRTGMKEPRWPRTLAATRTDGSVTWTCRAASSNALNAISDLTTEVEPAGAMTIANAAVHENFKLRATYVGGTEGQDYDAVYTFTINSCEIVLRQRVLVRRQ